MYRNLIELPHYAKWMKPKQARHIDTYKELNEEMELIERMKRAEIEKKEEQKNNKEYIHIFQVVDEYDDEELGDEDGLGDSEEVLDKDGNKLSDAQLMEMSIDKQTKGNSPNTELSLVIEEKIRRRIKKSPLSKPDSITPGQSRGDLWLIYREVIARNYINFFNHIFFGAFMETRAIQTCPIVPHLHDTSKKEYRDRFYTWLDEHCSIDSNDDFMPRYRQMTQERMLPMGIRSRRFRREATIFNWEQGMELMQDYLGMQCSTILHDIVYAKKMDVCKDREHPCFESLCITLFIYMVEHESRDKSFKFMGKCYIQHTDIDESTLKWINEDRLYGYPRPPIIIESLNRYFVNVARFDEETCQVTRMQFECQDMIHAILSWVYYIHIFYKSTLRVKMAVNMENWYKQFFLPPKASINLSEVINNKK